MLKKSLVTIQNGECPKSNIITGDGYRISLLTERIFRVEVKGKSGGEFLDKPTQSIWFRNIKEVSFKTKEEGNLLKITTDFVEISFDKAKKAATCVLFLKDNKKVKINNKGNLKGTRRTLDMTFGEVKIGDGLVSKNGVSVIDDSASLVIEKDGTIAPRPCEEKDIYIFAFGNDFRAAIKEFYMIAGQTPIIPRFALGVWWSRYRAYTQEEYLKLIQRFFDEKIPLTVATVDMDWHWVNLEKQFGIPRKGVFKITGSGWTGYSWDTNLFPDYKYFLQHLKNSGLQITLNLHPADGVRYFEDMYPQMCKAMGIDPATKADIKFDVSDTNFWNNYFDILHKPYEKDGVDFWWIDWQQGKKSQIPGLDPLWALNHYHYLDNAEDGRIPLILSRFAGAGSHRYPLGFSGDTAINWKVLDFQPYFTLTASNIGYTWWSHDIGGHHHGYRDEELYTRWLQYGVFTPIMRLHSTSNDLLGKEPWMYTAETASIASNFLRLRHSLIPYLYTMDYKNHKEGVCLTEPMYFAYPNNPNAYAVKNEFMFGSELLVCPVTTKADKLTRLAKTKVWIPEGRWVNIFTRKVYYGDKILDIYSDTGSIPVLAKEGGIIPMSLDEGNSPDNPKKLKIMAASGNGEFNLYEDNGKTSFESHKAITNIKMALDKELKLTISAPKGDLSVLPAKRSFVIEILDLKKVGTCIVKSDGNEIMNIEKASTEYSDKTLIIEVPEVDITSKIEVIIKGFERLENDNPKDDVIAAFAKWQAGTEFKKRSYHKIKDIKDLTELEAKIKKLCMPKSVKGAALEVFRRKK